MDTNSFIFNVKTDDIYKETAEDAETRFNTSTLKQTDHYLQEKIKK